MFLTPEQVRELTGYRQHGAQIRWLRQQGIRHWVRADGRPVVPTSALDGLPADAPRVGPDFSSLRPPRGKPQK